MPAKTFDDIYLKIKNRLENGTKLTNYSPGSIVRSITEGVSSELSEIYSNIDKITNDRFVTTASGDALDKLGEVYGIIRKTSTYSVGTVVFTIDALSGQTVSKLRGMLTPVPLSIIIPKGTIIKSASGISYTTLTAITLTDGEVSVGVISDRTGATSNIGTGELNTWVNSTRGYEVIKDYILVTNKASIDNGGDVETDINYRYRLFHYATSAAKANEMAIRIACLSVPGVSDVEIIKGINEFSVLIKSESPIVSEGLKITVQDAINRTQALGVQGWAITPNYKGVSVSITLEFVATYDKTAEKDAITKQALSNVIDYINSIPIDSPLSTSEIIQRGMDTSDYILALTIQRLSYGPFDTSYGRIDYTDTSNSNTITGTMPIKVTTDPLYKEKFVTTSTLTSVCYV